MTNKHSSFSYQIIKHKNNSAGFTLIEISIALVVVALLVGGIVSASKLIDSSKLQRIISDSASYRTAWTNFVLKYENIPGDFKESLEYWNDECNGNTWCKGNNNGLITSSSSNNSEGVAAMSHLKFSGNISGDLAPGDGYSSFRYPSPGTSHNSSAYHYNVPSSKHGAQPGKDGWVFASHNTIGESNWFDRKGNWLMFGSVTQGRLLDGSVLTQKQTYSIDKKIDDGFPATGDITASTGSRLSTTSSTSSASSPPCVTGGSSVLYNQRDTTKNYSALTYNISEDNRSCVLHFYFGL